MVPRLSRTIEGTRWFLTVLLLWLLAAPAVWAAADPLLVIPDNALGVAVVNDLSETSARVRKLTEKMQLPVPELLPMAQLYTGAQQGVDLKGTLAAAMFPAEDESATWLSRIAVFVPVTDYKVFVAQLQPDDANAEICEVTVMGQTFLATHKGDFAVMVTSDAKPLLEQIRGSSKNVAPLLDPIRSWLDEQQVAVALTPSGKDLVMKTASGFLETMMDAAQQVGAADNDDTEDEKRAAADSIQSAGDMMRGLGELLSAANEQVTHVGLGVRIDDALAFHLSARLLFKEHGGLSQWSEAVRRPEAGLLAGLPPGKFTLAFGGAGVQFHPAVAELFNRMTQTGMLAMGLDEKDQQQLVGLMARQRANQTSTATLMGRMRPGDSIYSTTIKVAHVKDAPLQMKLTREFHEIFSRASFPGADPASPAYSMRDVTVGDLKALEVTMDMGAMIAASTGEAQPDAARMVRGLFDSLIGNEGVMRAYLTVADEHTLVLTYSKEQLERAVEHVRSGKAGMEDDEQIARTDKLLPAGAQWAAYVNPRGIVQWVDRLLEQLLAGSDIRIPPFPDSEPIGLAAKVTAEGLDAELVLPESVVAGIGQYVGMIQQMMMQRGAPLP